MQRLGDLFPKNLVPIEWRSFEVSHLWRTLDSSLLDVAKSSVFFAIDGQRVHGVELVSDFLRLGGRVVVAEKLPREELPENIFWIKVNSVRAAWAVAQKHFYGDPDQKLSLYAVTGTNGKTTTAYLLQHLLGNTCGRMTTIDVQYLNFHETSQLTTPDAKDLFRHIARALSFGCQSFVFEASSHALDQKRFWGAQIEGAIFTQLSQDHLDYHHDLNQYFDAKSRLFDGRNGSYPKVSVVNLDDSYGQRLIEKLRAQQQNVVTFGRVPQADWWLKSAEFSPVGTTFKVAYQGRDFEGRTQLLGEFNLENILGALAVLTATGSNPETLLARLADFKSAPGRLQRVELPRRFPVFVDFAHTPEALRAVILTLKRIFPKNPLITVFGCGGDRDAGKRPLMGSVVGNLSDVGIATADNSRSEQTEAIFDDIRKGESAQKLIYIEERAAAIEYAVQCATAGNGVVLIAGKGHENYQIIGRKCIPFSDVDVAKKVALRLLSGDVF